MGDPILALKWFVLFVVIGIALAFAYRGAKMYRLMFGKIKILASNTESVLLILTGIDAILCIGSLLWSAIAWIVS